MLLFGRTSNWAAIPKDERRAGGLRAEPARVATRPARSAHFSWGIWTPPFFIGAARHSPRRWSILGRRQSLGAPHGPGVSSSFSSLSRSSTNRLKNLEEPHEESPRRVLVELFAPGRRPGLPWQVEVGPRQPRRRAGHRRPVRRDHIARAPAQAHALRGHGPVRRLRQPRLFARQTDEQVPGVEPCGIPSLFGPAPPIGSRRLAKAYRVKTPGIGPGRDNVNAADVWPPRVTIRRLVTTRYSHRFATIKCAVPSASPPLTVIPAAFAIPPSTESGYAHSRPDWERDGHRGRLRHRRPSGAHQLHQIRALLLPVSPAHPPIVPSRFIRRHVRSVQRLPISVLDPRKRETNGAKGNDDDSEGADGGGLTTPGTCPRRGRAHGAHLCPEARKIA